MAPGALYATFSKNVAVFHSQTSSSSSSGKDVSVLTYIRYAGVKTSSLESSISIKTSFGVFFE